MKYSVFKFLFAITLICAIQPSFGQYITRHSKDSASASETRYITWTATPDIVKGIEVSINKVSGAVAATVTLERRIDTIGTGSGWVAVSGATYTATDVAWQYTIFPVNPQDGNGYRIKIVATSATQKAYYFASYIKRTQ